MQEFPDSTWEDLLPAIRFGMTVAIQPSGYSAFQLLYGTLPRLGPLLVLTDPTSIPMRPNDIISQLWPDLYVLRHEAMCNIKHAALRMKEAYDKRHHAKRLDFVVGDYVWLVQHNAPGVFHKWSKKYSGPYINIAMPANNMAQLVTTKGNYLLPFLVQTERLKKFLPEENSPLRMQLK